MVCPEAGRTKSAESTESRNQRSKFSVAETYKAVNGELTGEGRHGGIQNSSKRDSKPTRECRKDGGLSGVWESSSVLMRRSGAKHELKEAKAGRKKSKELQEPDRKLQVGCGWWAFKRAKEGPGDQGNWGI